jgi:hypothetical protein
VLCHSHHYFCPPWVWRLLEAKNVIASAYFGTFTQCLVHPTVPVLLTKRIKKQFKRSPINEIIHSFQPPHLEFLEPSPQGLISSIIYKKFRLFSIFLEIPKILNFGILKNQGFTEISGFRNSDPHVPCCKKWQKSPCQDTGLGNMGPLNDLNWS